MFHLLILNFGDLLMFPIFLILIYFNFCKFNSVIFGLSLAESQHFCQLLENKAYLRYGFYTPSPNGNQKYFILINNYYCEMEPILNASQPQHFGYTLAFKNNKICERSDFFGPLASEPVRFIYPSAAFSVAHGLFWSKNLIGLAWV